MFLSCLSSSGCNDYIFHGLEFHIGYFIFIRGRGDGVVPPLPDCPSKQRTVEQYASSTTFCALSPVIHDWQKEDRIMSEPSLSAPIILNPLFTWISPSMTKCGVYSIFVSGRQLGPAVGIAAKHLVFHLSDQLPDTRK